jgi:hypothetical protein
MKMKGIVQLFAAAIGVVILLIVVFAVLQPVTNSMITSTSSNLGGYSTANTVAQQLPTFNVLVGLAMLAALVLGAFTLFGR